MSHWRYNLSALSLTKIPLIHKWPEGALNQAIDKTMNAVSAFRTRLVTTKDHWIIPPLITERWITKFMTLSQNNPTFDYINISDAAPLCAFGVIWCTLISLIVEDLFWWSLPIKSAQQLLVPKGHGDIRHFCTLRVTRAQLRIEVFRYCTTAAARFPGKTPDCYKNKYINATEPGELKSKSSEFRYFESLKDRDLPYIPCLRLGGRLFLSLYYDNREWQPCHSGKYNASFGFWLDWLPRWDIWEARRQYQWNSSLEQMKTDWDWRLPGHLLHRIYTRAECR